MRGILERPAAQSNANPRGLSRTVDHITDPFFVHIADIDFAAGGRPGTPGKPPFSIRPGVKQNGLFWGLGGPLPPRVGAYGPLLGGGGAPPVGIVPRAARRRIPGPAIAMARPGTLPGSLGGDPSRLKLLRGRPLTPRRAVPVFVFSLSAPAALARPDGGSQVRPLRRLGLGSPPGSFGWGFSFEIVSLNFHSRWDLGATASRRAYLQGPRRMHAGVIH